MKIKFKKLSVVLAGAMLISSLWSCGPGAIDAEPVKEMKNTYRDLVKLNNYKGVTYTPTDTTVTDEDVQNQLDYLVSQNTTKEQIMTGTAAMGDSVNIDYTGYIDGVAFENGSTENQGTSITLGSSGYIDNFDEQIAGHKPGDKFDVNVTFPEDYGVEELNGKAATFETTLNYIEGEEIVPEVNDSFINTATNGEYTSVEDFKKRTRESLEQSRTENAVTADKQAILQKIIDETTIVEYPEKELKEKAAKVIASYETYAQSTNVDLSTFLSYYYGYTAEQFEESVKSAVESYVREKMVVIAIADAEGITCTQEEFDEKIKETLAQTNLTDVSQLYQQYDATEEDFYFSVIEDKVLQLVYENAVAEKATSSDAVAEKASSSDAAAEAVDGADADAE